MRLKPIHQQVVVIMGASSGIGRETALQFAERGARVVVAARSESGLQSLVEEIRRRGGEATAVTADTADFDQVKAVADKAVDTYGRLDTWVHAAAVSLYATVEETTVEEFKQVIDINLLGQIYGAKAALPHLRREGRGALIHISSLEAMRALPYQSAYAASKHGVAGFTEALRLELQGEGVPISVTNILPTSINTPLFDKARTKLGVKPRGIPPMYEPETVAGAILHAAEHPTRHRFVGTAGRMTAVVEALSPSLLDALFSRIGFKVQRTDEPKAADAPDNLFGPIEGYNRVEGDFSRESMPISLYDRLQNNAGVVSAIAGLALGVAAARRMRDGRGSRQNGTRRSLPAPTSTIERTYSPVTTPEREQYATETGR